MMERWLEIGGYPAYEVSDYGRVRRKTRGRHTLPGKILKGVRKGGGYLGVRLYRPEDKKPRDFLVHLLVISAFKGPPPHGRPICRHLDDNKTNNFAWNLEWGSWWENLMDWREKQENE